MKILVVNDDGINAEGIKRLAKMAVNLGDVYVVAPANQCSAMSQRITVMGEMTVKKIDFDVEGIVSAYSVTGTPADCVKVAVNYIIPGGPDIVFSGINNGVNCGYDILYSGTVGAALEALSQNVPAIAISCEMNAEYDAVDKYILDVTKEAMSRKLPSNVLWNINFPGCKAEEVKGIVWDAIPAYHEFYMDNYERRDVNDDEFVLRAAGIPVTEAANGTDIGYVLDKYITIGVIKNYIIK